MSAVATSKRMHGPAAFEGGVRRFLELTLTLARTEFKLRYYGSALGYVWSLVRPILFFGVLYVFFTQILHVGKGIPHYGVYLLTGIVLWNYVLESTTMAVTCMVDREALIRKIRFPRMVLPLSVSLTGLFNLGMNLIAVLVFALANGVYPRLSWLWMLPILLGYILIASGLAMLLSALYVRFRDIKPIWDVTAQILFYASPIMYVATNYHGLEHYMMASPFAEMLTQMGHSFIHPGIAYVTSGGASCHPGTAGCGRTSLYSSYYDSGHSLLPPIISIFLIFAIFGTGLWVFTREAPRVAEHL
jgi:ABC-2 type transport system permease protein